MLAELHSHSHYSKGIKIVKEGLDSPLEMAKRASELGLGAIAISDHNQFRAYRFAKKIKENYNVILIPAEEISTGEGHLNALGINERIKPGLGLLESIDRVHEQDGIAVAVHPFDIKNEGTRYQAKHADVIEAFNGLNVERVSNLKNIRYAESYKKPMVNGSDAHSADMVGWAVTEVNADNMDDILKAIKKGKTRLHNEYVPIKVVTDWAVERMKLSYVQILTYINQNYHFPKAHISRNALRLVNKSPGKIDYLFRMAAYFGMGNAIIYGACKEIIGW